MVRLAEEEEGLGMDPRENQEVEEAEAEEDVSVGLGASWEGSGFVLLSLLKMSKNFWISGSVGSLGAML